MQRVAPVFKVQHWWGNGQPEEGTPYEILCACGKACRGRRASRYQVIACPGCGHKLFVLPQGPFNPPADSAANVAALPSTARHSGINPWLWPIMAGGLTLAIVSAVLVLILSHLQTGRTGRPSQPSRTVADVESRVQVARKAIAGGDLKKAVEELEAARE